jgi:hypothetical protein
LSFLLWVTKSNYPCGVFKLLVNVLPVLHSVTDSNYPCGILGEHRQYIYQKFEDTTGVIRICNSRENRQLIYQKFEYTTGVIRIWNWKENRQYICRMFEDTTEVIRICNWMFSLELHILITPVVIFKLLVNVFSVLLSVTDSNYPCGYLQTFGKCVFCSSFSYKW